MRKKEGQEWMVVPLPGGAAGGGLVWVHRVKVQVGDNASLQPRRWLGIGTVNWGGSLSHGRGGNLHAGKERR